MYSIEVINRKKAKEYQFLFECIITSPFNYIAQGMGMCVGWMAIRANTIVTSAVEALFWMLRRGERRDMLKNLLNGRHVEGGIWKGWVVVVQCGLEIDLLAMSRTTKTVNHKKMNIQQN